MSRLGTRIPASAPRPSAQSPPPSPENTDGLPSWVEDVSFTLGHLYILCGTLGVGKTSLAAQFPDPLFLVESTDIGALNLRSSGGIDPNTKVMLMNSESAVCNTLEKISKGGHPFRTVVFEGLSGWWHRLVLPQVRKRIIDSKGDPDSWAADQKEALATEVLRLERSVYLCLRAGYNVVLTAHTADKTKPNVGGMNFMTQMIDIPKAVTTVLCKNASGVFCITHVPEVIDISKSEKDILTKVSKVKDHERRLFLNPTAGIEHAKNQFRCTEESVPYESASQVFTLLLSKGMQVNG
jgi:hypothetical protein